MNNCDLHLQGVGKLMTPIFYKGKIVKIMPGKTSSFVESDLHYESKIHIEKALSEKALIKVSAPAEEKIENSKPEGEK